MSNSVRGAHVDLVLMDDVPSDAPAGARPRSRTRGIVAKGRSAETAFVDLARRSGWPHAERRRLEGVQDRGDVAGMPGLVVEVKSGARLDLPGWLRETERERAHDGADFGLLIVKPKGVGDTRVHEWHAVMPVGELLRLLALAGYGDGTEPFMSIARPRTAPRPSMVDLAPVDDNPARSSLALDSLTLQTRDLTDTEAAEEARLVRQSISKVRLRDGTDEETTALRDELAAMLLHPPLPARRLRGSQALAPCGTRAAYRRHRAHHEKPCDACQQANTATWSKYRRDTADADT